MNFFIRLKYALLMSFLALLEIGPIPIAPIIGLFIIIFLPSWFKDAVDRMYHSNDSRKK
ncbi:hypothetical protein [Methylotuvimicrobium buryatense]|uniref:hypothetical protein n=1 Tax=Methylotuvimicrobium buryatense TaxID=95641 RepID=UPI001AD8C3A7|nr:hypothetical protein [Methylotuvimicrobium buryatense]